MGVFDNMGMIGGGAFGFGAAIHFVQTHQTGIWALPNLAIAVLVCAILGHLAFRLLRSHTSVASEFRSSGLYEDREPEVAAPNPHGWVRCQACGIRFKPTDPRVWNGKIHHCGQRIEFAPGETTPEN